MPTPSHERCRVIVRRARKVLLEREGYAFEILQPSDKNESPTTDLTGDGVPDLALQEFSGGMHCCYALEIFSCGTEFKRIVSVDTQNSKAKFSDLDGDGIPEITVVDWTFHYWPSSFAGSPAPEVILKWDGTTYAVAANLMRKPLPDRSELEKQASEFKHAAVPDEVSPEENVGNICSVAVEFMYSGHESKGWEFIEMACSDETCDRKTLDEFRKLLKSSPYWEELKTSNKGP